VQALETDTNFRAKLEKANEDDIRVSIIRIIDVWIVRLAVARHSGFPLLSSLIN